MIWTYSQLHAISFEIPKLWLGQSRSTALRKTSSAWVAHAVLDLVLRQAENGGDSQSTVLALRFTNPMLIFDLPNATHSPNAERRVRQFLIP